MRLFVDLISFSLIYLFNNELMRYCMNLLNVKIKTLTKVLPVIISIISMILIHYEIYTFFEYIIMFFIYIVLFKVAFDDSIGIISNIMIYQTLCIILFRDIFIGVLSIVFTQSMYQLVKCYEIYVLSFGLCRLAMCILLNKFKKIYDINIVKKLLINRKKLIMNNLTVISLFIILFNSDYICYYIWDYIGNISFSIYFIIVNRLCIGFCFFYSLNMGIKSIKMVEEEVFYKSSLLALEHNENLNKKIDEYSNLLRIYNHDFKNILISIKDCIEIGDINKAKNIISEFDKNIEAVTEYNKKLSNNYLINALLNRLYTKCKQENIYFDSDCYIPNNVNITNSELINIFNNLSSNAFEACIKQNSDDKKWISFKSYVKDNTLIIYQSNTFNGYIKFRNDKLITTKKNKKLHGIGVESIKHIVHKANGISLIKIDEEKKEFRFLIKIPLLENEYK
ncbi:sensor histidine kinase [Clostridium perfringens]|uniref:sensor histidine kinase n=1 Tax=Clostridium perfringens TaxID=1502 RepID=UPI000DA39428|nr:GHKL domain-containing protein [Clostridium perfringens]SQI05408.1 signal transduction histidine kinase regulating citrate/malate metabolism [Clostridium perfringens]